MNVTLAIDDRIVKAVRKTALEHHTTMTAMIRNYLEQVAAQEMQSRERALLVVRQAFATPSFMGPSVRPTREELHER